MIKYNFVIEYLYIYILYCIKLNILILKCTKIGTSAFRTVT